MARRRQTADSTTNRPLAIFATLLVVVGIVGVAYVSSLRSTPTTTAPSTAATSTAQTSSGPVSQPLLLLVNDSSVSLLSQDGTVERLSLAEFSQRAANHHLPNEGSSAANGALARFSSATIPATPGSAPPLVWSPQGTYAIQPGAAQSDAASVVQLSRGNEAPQKLVLRSGTFALKDADVLGWFSDTQFAVVATATGSRALYTVGITGQTRYLATLPDTVLFLAERDGSVWYATAVPGEGIEDPPKGPSEIHRIDSTGHDTMFTQDAIHVVENVVPDTSTQDTRIAYTTDDGLSYLFTVTDGKRITLGKDRALLFLSGNTLVLRRDYDLELMDIGTGQIRTLTTLPEGSVSVFDATPFLDAAR